MAKEDGMNPGGDIRRDLEDAGGGVGRGAAATQSGPGRIEAEIAGAAAERRRREEAERAAEERAERIADLEMELESVRSLLTRAEKRAEIERGATAAGAVDGETALVLIEREAERKPEASVDELVGWLRSRKPFLFQSRRTPGDVASGSRGRSGILGSSAAGGGREKLEEIAERARVTGDRRQLAHYLAARRGG